MSIFDEIIANKKYPINLKMTDARAIGKSIRAVPSSDETLSNLFAEFKKEWMNCIKSLPTIAQDILFVIIDNYDEQTKTFHNLICILTPRGTEVPDGYDYKDISACHCVIDKPGQDYGDLSCFLDDKGYEFVRDIDQFWQGQIHVKRAKLTRIIAPIKQIDFSYVVSNYLSELDN